MIDPKLVSIGIGLGLTVLAQNSDSIKTVYGTMKYIGKDVGKEVDKMIKNSKKHYSRKHHSKKHH